MKRVGVLLAALLMAGACGGTGGTAERSGPRQDETTTTARQATTTTTTEAAASRTAPEDTATTTEAAASSNPWPLLADELAARLGCVDLHQPVWENVSPAELEGTVIEIAETEWNLDCDSDFGPYTSIYLFESEAQQERFLSFWVPGRVVLGPGWAVAVSSGSESADDMALATDGVVFTRGGSEAPATPPTLDPRDALSASESYVAIDQALALWTDAPLEAIPLLNRVIASLPPENKEAAGLRAEAMLFRGELYEHIPGPSFYGAGEAIISYEWLIDQYGPVEDDAVVFEITTVALYHLGFAILEDEPSRALGLFDQVIDRAAQSGYPSLDFYVADSWWGIALIHGAAGDQAAAVAALHEIVDNYAHADDPAIAPVVADAQAALDRLPSDS